MELSFSTLVTLTFYFAKAEIESQGSSDRDKQLPHGELIVCVQEPTGNTLLLRAESCI